MANNKKVQEEDLKKLEDEAYFELCQIIAEAMELQDVDLLNARIASWKNKYKKLLDRPSTNSRSDFKKRIEFLLTQYYSEVTKYILSQLKLQEEKKIENQSKALRELYSIIRDTNDYDLLKKKVEKWKEKYPISGFLKMYQKRIELYTRDKNIRENAFKQEEAFNDLVDITKVHGTFDELKNELTLWEKKYSINDKYTIDDFLKHQTEIKRYTSDEFLQSIAREDFNPYSTDKTDIDIVSEYNTGDFSNLSVQASAYAALLKISKTPNAVNEMFTWVYKNSNVKFNDKYKELILNATYLNYSPAYLTKLQKPNMDMSKSSLSFDEYININDIKKYAIISYFNLLLPPEKAIANNYFNKHIQTIYAKSEKARVDNVTEEPISTGVNAEPILDLSLEENGISNEIETVVDIEPSNYKEILQEETINEPLVTEDLEESKIIVDISNSEPETKIELEQPEENKSDDEKPLDYTTIVAVSPLFFKAINNYNKQAVLINHIDNTTTKYVEVEKAKELSLNGPIKTKIEEN